MDVNTQFFINIVFGVITFFGGWVLRVIFSQIKDQREEYKDLAEAQREDYKRVTEDLTALAISLPNKYVSKNDFAEVYRGLEKRFDRLEEKIDDLNVNNK